MKSHFGFPGDCFPGMNSVKRIQICIEFKNFQSIGCICPTLGYKYLIGTIIDNKLRFDKNSEMLCKKGQQRLFCFRKLARFQVDKSLMKMFYCAFIESVISFGIICWYGNLSVKNKNSLESIVKTASKVAGVTFNSLEAVYKSRMCTLTKSIRSDVTHPLNYEYVLLPSGLRIVTPSATTNRFFRASLNQGDK